MWSIRQSIRAVFLVGASVVIALGSPLMVFADEPSATASDSPITSTGATPQATEVPAPTSSSTTPPPSTTMQTTTPPPAPIPSPAPAPKVPEKTYSYDATSGRWNSNEWTYDNASGGYKQTPRAPVQVVTPSNNSGSPTVIDATTTTDVANALDVIAVSGDASVIHNTQAGNATSGDASSAATIINNINSSLTNANNKEAASFVSDVIGDVNGDIMLQPMLLKAMLEAGAQQPGANSLHSATNTGIQNDVTLGAVSGDATVAGNTNAGSATTGSAHTVANVMNIVNSMIAANQSFVGTINIYGNLNGDILIAPDFIPQLIAANGGAPAPAGTASVTSNDAQTIVNNIALTAQSGQSLVSGNTKAGNATTGNASTKTVIFNLTGHEVVASNSLLVFVNVLGKWVGVIVDAPTGTTAAAIGNNVTTNAVAPDLSVTATNTTQLTNNLTLVSQSGNATVAGNTNAGNATTGNATASANVANISNSVMGMSGWFGVLFINVFGNWFGSFGVDTAAGNPIMAVQSQRSVPSSGGTSRLRVIEFIPRAAVNRHTPVSVVQGETVVQLSAGNRSGGSAITTAAAYKKIPTTTETQGHTRENNPIEGLNFPLLFGSLVLIGGSLFGLRRQA